MFKSRPVLLGAVLALLVGALACVVGWLPAPTAHFPPMNAAELKHDAAAATSDRVLGACSQVNSTKCASPCHAPPADALLPPGMPRNGSDRERQLFNASAVRGAFQLLSAKPLTAEAACRSLIPATTDNSNSTTRIGSAMHEVREGNEFCRTRDDLVGRVFRRVVFGVLADPPTWHSRVVPLLRSWGRRVRRMRTFDADSGAADYSSAGHPSPTDVLFTLFFDGRFRAEWERSMAEDETRRGAVSSVLDEASARIHFLQPPTDFERLRSPNGAWKPLAILHYYWASMSSASSHAVPEWFVIVDDDTFLIPQNVALHLRVAAATARSSNDGRGAPDALPAIYMGHHVLRAPHSRNRARRYWFVYGGNGIFLSRAAITAAGAQLDRLLLAHGSSVVPPSIVSFNTSQLPMAYRIAAGDERLGALMRDVGVPVTPVTGGCEGFFSSVTEKASEFVASSAFPFAFHRATRPAHFAALQALLDSAPGFVSWEAAVTFALEPSTAACASGDASMAELLPQTKKETSADTSAAAMEKSTTCSLSSCCCWPMGSATPADWLPSRYDPKQRALDAYAAATRLRRSPISMKTNPPA